MIGRGAVVRRLVLVTTVVGLLTGAIGLAVVRHLERRTLLETAETAELAAAERNASVIDGRVEAVLSQLGLLATRDELVTDRPTASVVTEELDNALGVTTAVDHLALYDREGEPVAAAASEEVVDPSELAARADAAAIVEAPRVRVDRDGEAPVLELSVPVESPRGTAVGALVGRADLDLVADDVSRLVSTGGRASLVTGDGTTVADGDPERVDAGYVQPIDDLPEDRRVGSVDGPGGPVLVAAAPLSTLEGYVVVEQTEAEVVDQASAGLRGPAGVLVVVVVAIVAAVIATGRGLLGPLGPLAEAVRRLGAGERDVRVDEGGAGEVAALAHGFNTMAAALETRQRELENAERGARMSEERLRLVVEGVQDYAIVLLDVLGDVRTWNAGARRVTGRSEQELLGRRITSLADPNEPVDDPVPAATRTGRGESEGWYVRPDGTRFWGQLTVTALRRDDGAPYGYAAILQDVTERQAARQALVDALHREQEAAAELRLANQLKDEFLAVAAHELRTPLSAILGATELLADGPDRLGAEDAEHVRQVIWTHAQDMRDIGERLLDYTRLQAGEVRLVPRHVRLRGELDRSVAAVGRLLSDHELVVRVDDVELEIDPSLLRQVTTNLLSNAAKFSPAGSTVTLEASVVDQVLTLVVADTGPGIAAADHRRIFELFRQADNALASARGTGVGLAIVQRYVELLGGEVHVDSDLGRGARFTVRLPLEQDLPHAAVADDAEPGRWLD